ncbi:hypothetical protein EVAR_62070_1 [Eumeta japonica]|uniref:Uncharacterized protein n=1 Tax=Eumeta variegata TaxID=151549 RepID=A0A4C1YWY3_EUMVA|nr:hypothetical protein EVAR_62070_1 [Eumeta japonica]
MQSVLAESHHINMNVRRQTARLNSRTAPNASAGRRRARCTRAGGTVNRCTSMGQGFGRRTWPARFNEYGGG